MSEARKNAAFTNSQSFHQDGRKVNCKERGQETEKWSQNRYHRSTITEQPLPSKVCSRQGATERKELGSTAAMRSCHCTIYSLFVHQRKCRRYQVQMRSNEQSTWQHTQKCCTEGGKNEKEHFNLQLMASGSYMYIKLKLNLMNVCALLYCWYMLA